MAFPKDESGKWAQITNQVMGEYVQGRDKILGDSAARGFSGASGDAVMNLFELGQSTKHKLSEANGKLYDERRGILFQQEEFALKIIVQIGKLAMELYRQQLFNALEIEAANEDAFFARGKADVERLNSQTESRQIAIIRAKAEIEEGIAVYKQQLVGAERVTLGAETALVQAQLATARKKLEIIASIYQVLAAEKLVLVAENKKVAALTLVLAAERIVAEIKREMVPLYITKAQAKEALAAAITAEIPILKAIEELGYSRIQLKNAEMAAEHLIREAEEDLELARESFTRASTTVDFSRTQYRRLLAEYSNVIKQEIQAKHKELQEEGIDLRLDSGLARETIQINNEVALTEHEITNLTSELVNILSNMVTRATDHAKTVKASAAQTMLSAGTTHTDSVTSALRIFKG